MSTHAPPEGEALQRHMRFVDVYALAVGSVIGSGIFFLPGTAAAAMGPAAVLALFIGGVLAGILSLCYAEAASRFHGTGGAMRYAQAAFGDTLAFEVGWATWISRVVSWAALISGFVTTLADLWPAAADLRTLLCIGLVVTLTAINLSGVRMSGRINTVLTALKVIPLVAFVVIGVFHIDGAHFTPFAPHGYEPLGATTVTLLFAYVGFEGMVIPAAEMDDPRRNIPRCLMFGMLTVLVLYGAIWAVCTGTLPGLAGAESPVGSAAETFMGPLGAILIKVGIVVSLLGINAFMALVTPRALYALSYERLLPPWFGRVDGRHVPARAILVTSAVALTLALNGTFERLAVISVVARIAQYVPTCLSVLRLRGRPDVPPATFRVPGGPALPLVAVVVCGWLSWETPRDRLLWGAVAVLAGFVVFLPWIRMRKVAADQA